MDPDSDRTAPTKRMRLGTRSCTECRRRKVRCVFQEASSACVACTLHRVPCQAQQAAAEPGPKPTYGNSLSAQNGGQGTSLALLRKLDEMEYMIKQIRGSGALAGTSDATVGSMSLSSGASDELEEAERRRLLSTAATTPSPSNSGNVASGTDVTRHSVTDALESFGNTPLVSLFRDALHLPDRHGSLLGVPQSTSPALPSNAPALFRQPAVSGFSSNILLTDACLRAVLEATSMCFAVFPPCSLFKPPSTTTRAPTVTPPVLNRSNAATVSDDIRAALWSDSSDAAAKALLWTALCLFELPRSWTGQYADLADTQSLIDIYRRQAARMLSASSETGACTRHGVEARCLQIKLNVDLGFPRKAWLTARKAVSDCLLLGYHRAARQDKPHEQSLWHIALHTERETSMILGMPSSISNHTKCLLPILPTDEQNITPTFRLLHEMTVLLGPVTDHYQILMSPPPPGVVITDNLGPNYPKAFELDQTWESCRQIMPSDFWQEDNASSAICELRPVDLYIRQTTKVRYFIIGRHIHLPYALKTNQDRRYAYSRTACLEASREIIAAYQTLRNRGNAEWSPCGMLDFESFSAAMVLALAMLQDSASAPAQHSHQRSRQEDDDYGLLVELSLTFRKAHLLKGSCTVAQRAADVMDIILPILQGRYRRSAKVGSAAGAATADHDINIPFFGRLRVTFPSMELGQPSNQSLSSPSMPETQASDDMDMSYATQTAQMCLSDAPPTPPTIEFGVPFCNHDFHYNFDFDLELNADWMNSVDMGIYDWTTMLAPGPT